MTNKFMIAALMLIVGAAALTLDNAEARSRRHVSYSYDSYGAQSWPEYGWQGGGYGRQSWSGWQDEWSNDPSYGSGYAPRIRRQNAFEGTALDSMIASHAAANGVPLELARRVVARESGGNPRAVSRGNYGLMQIRLGTARAMGYTGSAAGLLDPDTNLTYAMKYLAGAHRAAGGNTGRAVSLYARGYYYEAKRQGWSPYQAAGGYDTGGYGSYGWSEAPRVQRRVVAGEGWSGGWNEDRAWSDRSWSGRASRRQVAWNDPSWGSWQGEPYGGGWQSDPSWNGWQDHGSRRKRRI